MSFFEDVTQLGEVIKADLIRAQCDSRKLPQIASRRLADMPISFDLDLGAIARHVVTTNVPQMAFMNFSDMPTTLYACNEFYIELLLWSNSSTTIHQHAFNGAFKVVAGSSFHSIWKFQEDQRVSAHMLVGTCHLDDAEILTVGKVRPILAGRQGLTHALFHLDHPSATLVVRTRHEPSAHPQLTLLPPHLAFDNMGLEKDKTVKLLIAALDMAVETKIDDPVTLFVDWCAQLDLPRLLQIVLSRQALLSGQWDRVEGALRAAHGDIVDLLAPVLEQMQSRTLVARTRSSVRDHDLRLFLALLMNLPSREWLFKLLQTQFPDRPAPDFCVDALSRLGEAESMTAQFMELASKAKMGSNRFSARLGHALPEGVSADERQSILRNLVEGRALDPDVQARLLRLSELSVFRP